MMIKKNRKWAVSIHEDNRHQKASEAADLPAARIAGWGGGTGNAARTWASLSGALERKLLPGPWLLVRKPGEEEQGWEGEQALKEGAMR